MNDAYSFFAVDIGCMFYFLAIAGPVKKETNNLRGLGTANVCRRSYVKIREVTSRGKTSTIDLSGQNVRKI